MVVNNQHQNEEVIRGTADTPASPIEIKPISDEDDDIDENRCGRKASLKRHLGTPYDLLHCANPDLDCLKRQLAKDIDKYNSPFAFISPHMAEYAKRLETLKRLKPEVLLKQLDCSLEEMARAGWYHTGSPNDDELTTYCCGVRARDWDQVDDPISRHYTKAKEEFHHGCPEWYAITAAEGSVFLELQSEMKDVQRTSESSLIMHFLQARHCIDATADTQKGTAKQPKKKDNAAGPAATTKNCAKRPSTLVDPTSKQRPRLVAVTKTPYCERDNPNVNAFFRI